MESLNRPTYAPSTESADPFSTPAPATLSAETTSLRSLVHHRSFVAHDAGLELVQQHFNETRMDFLALVRAGRVVGLCSRLRLGILLGTRFGFSLHSRSPAHLAQVEHPLVFVDTTPVREALDRSLARRGDEFHEDVVLVDSAHNLLGLIPVDALARLQSRLVSEQLNELRRQHVELFQANHALRQSQGLYLGLFESHSLGIALLDPSGGIHEYNRRLTELLNPGANTASLGSLTEWVIESERRSFAAMLELHARGGAAAAPESCEYTLNIPDRGARLFRISPGWIRETGQICACLEDITEQRSLERHMVRQEKQTLLDTLVGGIAHELNNKLTPVQGFSELICLTADASTRKYADLIARSVTESAEIIRQLLQLSKPASTLAHFVDLRTVVEEALTMLRFQIRKSRCQVTSTMHADPVWVRVDPAQVKQVVLNLVLNALYAVDDHDDARLQVEVSTAPGSARLSVTDNGMGIPPENLTRIFDPFFTTKGPESGTGLGLSICFSIIRQHSGDITVESVPGTGAKFTVSLPIESAVPLALALPDTVPPMGVPQHPALRPGLRVLVIDDEIVVRRLIQEMLTVRFGCRVDVAADGIEAIELITQERYALVVSDIRMPGMTGPEFFLWLRETQPALARRLIFVTGHAGEKHLEDEIAQWGVTVLMKPFTLNRFAEACAPYLRSAAAELSASA